MRIEPSGWMVQHTAQGVAARVFECDFFLAHLSAVHENRVSDHYNRKTPESVSCRGRALPFFMTRPNVGYSCADIALLANIGGVAVCGYNSILRRVGV